MRDFANSPLDPSHHVPIIVMRYVGYHSAATHHLQVDAKRNTVRIVPPTSLSALFLDVNFEMHIFLLDP